MRIIAHASHGSLDCAAATFCDDPLFDLPPTHTLPFLVRGLAAAFLAGLWNVKSLVSRGAKALGKRPMWLRVLAERIVERYPAT